MTPALLIRLRPTGPWRIGPDSGSREQVDRIYHSDALYSAVTGAMERLGMLEEWLGTTALNRQPSAVRFSSCFPWQDETLFIAPPRRIWPPVASSKLRAKGARFIPTSLAVALINEQALDEEMWAVDGPSECLLARERLSARRGPCRVAVRSSAAVDRLTNASIEVHRTACLEFAESAGLWTVAEFAGPEAQDRWAGPIEAAFRLLADSGLGGERSRGWGRSEITEIKPGALPDLIAPGLDGHPQPASSEEPQPAPETAHWLLSLFTPAAEDTVDWERGSYSLVTRSGRVESTAGWGAPKKKLRMVGEGSVLLAGSAPRGTAHDVAPDGFPHPVFRAGFAVSIPIPWRTTQ